MRASRVCPVPGCGSLTSGGRCGQHKRQVEQKRGTAHQRGYDTQHRAFRRAVLDRDTTCVLCGEPSTDADHWPLSKRELRARGMDDNSPAHGRGLCHSCHSRSTATTVGFR